METFTICFSRKSEDTSQLTVCLSSSFILLALTHIQQSNLPNEEDSLSSRVRDLSAEGAFDMPQMAIKSWQLISFMKNKKRGVW